MSGNMSSVLPPSSPQYHRSDANHDDDDLNSPTCSQKNLNKIWKTYDVGNWVLLICLVGLLIGIETVEPRHRLIINANDPQINYPQMPQQVNIGLLILLSEVIPVVVFVIIYFVQRAQSHAKRELYYVIFGFAYTLILCLIFTQFMKRMTGRPRPNFIQLSQYRSDGSYGSSASQVSNAFQSFPSGHTSAAFAGLGYLSIYLFRIFFPNHVSRDMGQKFHINQGYKSVLCLFPLILATWIGLTRIVDYWHSFDDVSIGALLGFSIALLTFQLHVGWWWSSVHPIGSPSIIPLSDNDSSSGVRRRSGPSEEDIHRLGGGNTNNNNGGVVSGRRLVGNGGGEEHSGAPLLDQKV